MFELSAAEIEEAVSQNVIPRRDKLGGAVPMAFTGQGVAVTPSSPKGGGKLQPPFWWRPHTDISQFRGLGKNCARYERAYRRLHPDGARFESHRRC
jgi:hypothetical protein